MTDPARRTEQTIRRFAREAEWAGLMIAATDHGDQAAYRALLEAVAGFVRSLARRGFARAGLDIGEAEDVVQETLLAIHLKRNTWRRSDPLGPWVTAIARNKLIDALRRRGRRGEVAIEDLPGELEAEETSPVVEDLRGLLGGLGERQRRIVTAISIEGRSVRETAQLLQMTDGAVRVALHRGLKALAARFRDGSHEDG